MENLDASYVISGSKSPDQIKAELLYPPLPSLQLGDGVLHLPLKSASTSPVYHNAGTRCISCGNLQMNTGGIDKGETGYVKGVVTYTITDDLSIAPLTTISGLTLMKNVKVVDIEEAMAILKASLGSKTVLSHRRVPWPGEICRHAA